MFSYGIFITLMGQIKQMLMVDLAHTQLLVSVERDSAADWGRADKKVILMGIILVLSHS